MEKDVVEKKNRTLPEFARSMLNEHDYLNIFFEEAVNITCYISNRVLIRS